MQANKRHKKILIVMLGAAILFYQLHGINVVPSWFTQENFKQKSYNLIRSPIFWGIAGGGVLALVLVGIYKKKIFGSDQSNVGSGLTESPLSYESLMKAIISDSARLLPPIQPQKQPAEQLAAVSEAGVLESGQGIADTRWQEERKAELNASEIGPKKPLFEVISAIIDSISDSDLKLILNDIQKLEKTHLFFRGMLQAYTRDGFKNYFKDSNKNRSFCKIFFLFRSKFASIHAVKCAHKQWCKKLMTICYIMHLLIMMFDEDKKILQTYGDVTLSLELEKDSLQLEALKQQVDQCVIQHGLKKMTPTGQILVEEIQSVLTEQDSYMLIATSRSNVTRKLYDLIDEFSNVHFKLPQVLIQDLFILIHDIWVDFAKIDKKIQAVIQAVHMAESGSTDIQKQEIQANPGAKERIFNEFVQYFFQEK